MFPNEVDEGMDGFVFGDIPANHLLFFVQRDFSGPGADVPIVGVRHFTRAVDDAAHDANFDAFQVMRHRSDFGCGFLKVKQRPATTRTTDVFSFADARPCGLEYGKRHGVAFGQGGLRRIDPESIAKSINHGPAQIRGCMQSETLVIQAFPGTTKHHWRWTTQSVQGKHGGTQVDHGMGVVRFDHPNHILPHASLRV